MDSNYENWRNTKKKIATNLHEPVEIVVDGRRISVVHFDDGWEFFRRDQHFVFVKDCASEIDSPGIGRGNKRKIGHDVQVLLKRTCVDSFGT